MCPEPQLLSVYLDGELPSPWKEKMEAHLSSCPVCAAELERLNRMSAAVRASAGPALDDACINGAKDRLWAKLAAATEGAAPRRNSRRAVSSSVSRGWRRSVTLPLPAAAAAAVFIFALMFAFVIRIQPSGAAGAPPDMADAAPPVLSPQTPVDFSGGNIIQASSMGEILQYLEQDGADYMIMRLPESKNFSSSGEPLILNAVDYSRRAGGR